MLDCNQTILNNGSTFYYIDAEGLEHSIEQPEAVAKVVESKYTVKVEGLEAFYKHDKSVHAFISPSGSTSFNTHSDPIDLEIRCLHGRKWMNVAGVIRYVVGGGQIHIRKNVPHKAINTCYSVCLSWEV